MNRIYSNFLLLVCVAFFNTPVASQPLPEWSAAVSTGFDWYWHDNPIVKLSSNGHVIVAGNIINNGNGEDILVVKYSPGGALLWLTTFNYGPDSLDDHMYDMNLDSLGNIYLTGYSTIDSLNTDIVTLKYNTSGNLIWSNFYGGSLGLNDEGKSLVINNNLEVFVTGTVTTDSSTNFSAIAAHKIDSSGNTVWTQLSSPGTNTQHEGQKIAVVNSNVIIIGESFSWSDYYHRYVYIKFDNAGNNLLTVHDTLNNGLSSFYIDHLGNAYIGHLVAYRVTKINASGNVAWTRKVATNLPPNVGGDEVTAIITDALNNVYITGRHYGLDYFGPSYTNADMLTRKYNSSGTLLWSQRYEYLSNNAADIPHAIFLDDNLQVLVAGGSQRAAPATDYDYVVVKYNNNGAGLGSIRFDDAQHGDDVIHSICADQNGYIYVTGLTYEMNSFSNTTTQKYRLMVGMDEMTNLANNTLVYPNPADAYITIANLEEGTTVEISDISGKTIMVIPDATHGNHIDISHLQNGIYTLRLQTNRYSSLAKFIKR